MNNIESYIDKIVSIREKLRSEEVLCQFAEECSEAAHAALKLRRALTGENPTPVSVQDAGENLLEELTDIVICVDVLALDFYRSEEKAVRWINRLDSRTEKRDET